MSSPLFCGSPRRCPSEEWSGPPRQPPFDIYDVARCGGDNPRPTPEEMFRSRRWLIDLGKVTVEALVRHMMENGTRLKDTDSVLGVWNYYLDQLLYDRSVFRVRRNSSPAFRQLLGSLYAEEFGYYHDRDMTRERKRALERAMNVYFQRVMDPKGETLSVELLCCMYAGYLIQDAMRFDGFLEELNGILRHAVPISLYWGPYSLSDCSRVGSPSRQSPFPSRSRSLSSSRSRSRSPYLRASGSRRDSVSSCSAETRASD